MKRTTLRAGTGRAELNFPEDVFPTPVEAYTGIHDAPLIHVLLLEAGIRVAVVTADIVLPGSVDEEKRVLSEALELDEYHILYHTNHTLSVPHFTFERDSGDREKNVKMKAAVRAALRSAAVQAKSSMEEAVLGFGLGVTDINVNRVIRTSKGWWQGTNVAGVSDHSLSVIRVDRLDGTAAALWFNCNTVPGVLENSRLRDGSRLISGDIASCAERYLEEAYPNAIAMYSSGATGDQWPRMRAIFDTLDREGNYSQYDLHEQGFFLAGYLGRRLGEQVMRTAGQIRCAPPERPFSLLRRTFTLPGQEPVKQEAIVPTWSFAFSPAEPEKTGVSVLSLGDIAVACCQPELDVETARNIIDASPYKHTFLMEYVDGAAGYMVKKPLYDIISYQSRKSRFASGSAELFTEMMLDALRDCAGRDLRGV